MPVSSAPFPTATSAIRLNSAGGTPPAALTISRRGALDAASWSVGTIALAATPTPAYTRPATISAPKSARG